MPVLQVVGGGGGHRLLLARDSAVVDEVQASLGARVRARQPSAVTTTVSSMRTPPCSGR